MKLARFVLLGTTLGLLALQAPGASAQSNRDDDDRHAAHGGSSFAPLVRAVRDVTKGFQNPDDAVGYGQFLGCVSGGVYPGAMGVHYVNGAYLDDQIDVTKPEALMYERRNGRWNLLGVEYIVDVKKWHMVHKEPTDVPVLMGQVFTYNGSPNRYGLDPFYALHVWAWRANPQGAFVDWNTTVSCDQFVAQP
jgi:hypothetical protein